MLTPRGWWLLLFVLFLTALGTAVSSERGGMLAILGLALLAWFTVEWARFQVCVRWNLPKLVLEREGRDDRGPLATLSARGPGVVLRPETLFAATAGDSGPAGAGGRRRPPPHRQAAQQPDPAGRPPHPRGRQRLRTARPARLPAGRPAEDDRVEAVGAARQ